MVIATMHLGEDTLSIEDFINMPKEQHVFISLIATMKSLPNGILVWLPLKLLFEIETHTCVAYILKRLSQIEELVQLEWEVANIVEDDDPSSIDIDGEIVEESTPPTSHSWKRKAACQCTSNLNSRIA